MGQGLRRNSRWILAVLLLAAWLLPRPAQAAPAYPVVRDFEQPSGEPLELRLWGDEFIHGWETLDGLTVLQNEATGYWEYATRNTSGELILSGVVVGEGRPPIVSKIRPSEEAYNAARLEEGAEPLGVYSIDAAPPWAGADTDILFLFVAFSDVPCTFTAAQMQANMFGGAATGPGDLDDYYREISYGAFDIDGTVAGCFTLPNTKNYYDSTTDGDDELVNDALALADPTVDFSIFDNDSDGTVDALGIIYAGGGPHDGCDTDDGTSGSDDDELWPHATSLPGAGTAVDGVNVDPYIINSEVTFGVNPSTGCTQIQTIGLFAHELGHSLGLPDLYDTDGSSQGLDDWSTMASQYASTVNLADTPAHFDAWSKWVLGWVSPDDLTGVDVAAHPIPQVSNNSYAVQLLPNPGGPEIGGSGEYFLIENRQLTGFDQALPGCGLIVWHIEESQTNNENEGHTAGTHRLVDIEEADGLDELDLDPSNTDARADAGDPFPGSTDNREFDDTTTPHANLYDGSDSDARMFDVSDCAPVMLANFGDPQADLILNKSADPDPIVIAGEELIYRLSLFNAGPDDATSVVLTDTLPAELIYLADTFGCDASNLPELVCDLGIVEAGEFIEILIKTRVDPTAVRDEPDGTIVIVNQAEVTSEVEDPNPENNVAEQATFVQDLADLKITKIVEPHTGVQAGEQFTYTLLVDNLGPSSARNVVITDTLVTSGFVDANGCSIAVRTDGGAIDEFNCNFALSTGVFDLGTFGANWLNPRSPSDMGRVIITINATAEEGLDLTNVATVTADTPDPDTSNNMAMVPVSVFDTVDLGVTKTALGETQVPTQEGLVFDIGDPGAFPAAPNYTTSPTHATAGRRIRYRLEVTNDGPSTAENVVLTDRLPAGMTIVPGSLTISQGSCETGTPGDPLDRLVCGLGTMADSGGEGPPVVLTFDVQVDPSLDPATVLENDVNVYSEQFDPSNANNHAHTQTIVETWADMEITKLSVGENKVGYDADLRRHILEDLAGQVTAGHDLRYEITVQNTGPSDARNVQILDLLPGQTDTGLDHDPVTFVSADGATCRPLDEQQEIGVFGPGGGKFGQVLWCDLGTIPTGARHTFDIYVTVDPAVPDGFTLTNGAFVWWGASSPPAQPGSFSGFPFPQIPPELPTTDDPFLDDNFAETDTLVNAVADVYIQKVDVPASPALDRPNEPDHALAGNEHRYLLTFGNHGWSVARDIAIQDFLDFKQLGILGENFLRCEPFDIDDFVACSEAGGVVDVDLLLSQNEQIIPGSLNPGDEFKFYLITEVDPGYVLDADDFIATNDSRITTSTTDFHTANNVDAHDTLIVAEADLSIEKTDVFGDPLVDPDNYFLMCDPVQPGGMITYTLTVTNDGPSDAADVYVVDQLPADYVAVDPAQVLVNVSAGEVIEVRDDGRITVRLGNDLNNSGVAELGRLNAGSTESIRIQVMVRQDAECGGTAENHAYVEARQNDVDWPPAPDLLPGIGGGDRTPTHDPDETNNRAVETTTIECPKVFVNKTVSFDGQCPGRDITRINETGQPVTFCYEITNTGTTYLDTILITDTLTTRTTMPTVIFTDTITFGEDPKVPVAPGETVLRQVTVPHLTKECGIATDTVVVTAIPVNSGRTVLPCLAPVSAEDTAVIEIPCAGVDWRLALPILEQNAGAECEAWVQIQNVGDVDTKGLVVVWGDPGFCPPQAAGPLKVECTGLLRPGSAWTLLAGQVPNGARSAIVYSLSTDRVEVEPGTWVQFADVICDAAFFGLSGSHFDWLVFDTAYRTGGRWADLDFGKYQGEPLVASVNRSCPDAVDPNATSVAAYTGLSRDQLGARDPYSGAYMYYAPLIFASNAGLNTTLYLQNLGEECTSLEIWLKAQDNCLRPIIGDILTLAPGESVAFDPNTVVGPDWLGSAWIRATQPIAMVVDSMGANHFTSYVGVAADIDDLGYTYGNQVSFAPLIYSEYQGWDTAIQVQNLSPVVNAKVKVYFLDRSGDVITTLVDWICPRGSQTFFLPTIAALGGNWVGSARIESQDWWTPGTNPVDYPRISSVVLLEKWSDPARTTRREAVAYNGQTECLLYDWQVGSGRGGTQSGSAVFAVPLLSKGNRGVNSEFAISNLVAKPGFTDFAIFLYDQNGLLDFVCEKLHDRQVEYIDLATWGYVPPNFLGSAVVSATFWEHDVFDPNGGFVRNLVGLGGVVVERVGSRLGEPDIPGDESKAFEAAPIFDHFRIEDRDQGAPPVCPGQPSFGP